MHMYKCVCICGAQSWTPKRLIIIWPQKNTHWSWTITLLYVQYQTRAVERSVCFLDDRLVGCVPRGHLPHGWIYHDGSFLPVGSETGSRSHSYWGGALGFEPRASFKSFFFFNSFILRQKPGACLFVNILKPVLFSYNSNTIQVIHLRCAIQWMLVYSQSCAAIITIKFRKFHHPQKTPFTY